MINKDLIVALDVPNKNELINTLNRLPISSIGIKLDWSYLLLKDPKF